MPSIREARQEAGLAPAGKDFLAQDLTLYGLFVDMQHGPDGYLEITQHLQLIQGPLPLAENGEQLKHEGAIAAVFRLLTDLFLQIFKRFLQLSFTDQLFCSHW